MNKTKNEIIQELEKKMEKHLEQNLKDRLPKNKCFKAGWSECKVEALRVLQHQKI